MYLFMYVLLILFILAVIIFLGYKIYEHAKEEQKILHDFDEEWKRTLEEIDDCDEGDPADPFHEDRG